MGVSNKKIWKKKINDDTKGNKNKTFHNHRQQREQCQDIVFPFIIYIGLLLFLNDDNCLLPFGFYPTPIDTTNKEITVDTKLLTQNKIIK